MLLVHGIGEQQPGATLEEGGDALVAAARDWFGAANVEDLPVDHDPAGGPAQRRAVLVTRPDGEPLRVLLAESHWAAQVSAPPWRALMAWLRDTVPFLVQLAVTLALAVVVLLFAIGLRLEHGTSGPFELLALLLAATIPTVVLLSLSERLRGLVVGFIGDSPRAAARGRLAPRDRRTRARRPRPARGRCRGRTRRHRRPLRRPRHGRRHRGRGRPPVGPLRVATVALAVASVVVLGPGALATVAIVLAAGGLCVGAPVALHALAEARIRSLMRARATAAAAARRELVAA